MPHVDIAKLVLPDEWPDGSWDLLVLSEIGYYFDAGDLDRPLTRAADTTEPGATIVAVHWRGETDDPLTGDAVHYAIGAHPVFPHRGGYQEQLFRLDVYERRPR